MIAYEFVNSDCYLIGRANARDGVNDIITVLVRCDAGNNVMRGCCEENGRLLQ